MDIKKRININKSLNNEYIDNFIYENKEIGEQRKKIYKKWLGIYTLSIFCFCFLLSVSSGEFNLTSLIIGSIGFFLYLFIPAGIVFLLFVKLPEYKELSEEYINKLFNSISNDNIKYSKKNIYFDGDEEIISSGKNNNFLNPYTNSITKNSIEFIKNDIKINGCELKTSKLETYYSSDNKRRKRTVITNHNYILKFSINNLIEGNKKNHLVPKNILKNDNKINLFGYTLTHYIFIIISFIMIYWIILNMFYIEEVYSLINSFNIKELFVIIFPMILLVISMMLISKFYNKYNKKEKIDIPDNKINNIFDIYSNNKDGVDYAISGNYIENIFNKKELHNLEFLLTKDAIYTKLKLNSYFFIKKDKFKNNYLKEIKKLNSDIEKILMVSSLIINKK